ncbi:MAG: zinc-dependent metalloprotease [Trueperella sp.]|nr:zinc-dependent metalloprotease [Trueperella sp.]
MSNPSEDHNNWQEMLRAILGPQAAEEVIAALNAQGINPEAQLQGMLTPENMQLITGQIQQLLGASGEGPVNWKIAEKVARDTIASRHLDRLTGAAGDAARQALSTASLWLDAASEIDPTTGPNMAWTRLDWVAHALPTFRRLFEPLGANISRAFKEAVAEHIGELPEQLTGFVQLPGGIGIPGGGAEAMIEKMLAALLGMQYGGALAELAVGSFGSTDTGIPFLEGSSAALVPANIADFSAGLEVPESEVLAYVAVREVAAARLYTRVPWLRPRLLDTVAEFARGIDINTDAIEEQVRNMNFANPNEITEIDLSDVFALELTQPQQDAIARLEHLLSLIEGWVSEVSACAVAPHLPNAVALREMFARRYATDNPARHVWQAQMGVPLAPRMMRESVAFWQLANRKLDITQRDHLWSHPDLLPTPEVLANPEDFFTANPAEIESELDSFLEDLFAGDTGASAPHEPKFGEEDDAGGPNTGENTD